MSSDPFPHLTPAMVAAAAERLQGVANRTPVITSRTLDHRCHGHIYLKCENFQRVGAFKFRGAYNAVSQLTSAQRAAGVITHSSGNHAQGVALAARLHAARAVIVMPEGAPRSKREATAAYGADIVTCAAVDREQVCDELVARHGYTLIHPYDNEDVIAGQGTAAWELLEETGHLDLLLAPVGGGGLISGTALAAAARSPGCRVIGVEPAVADDANRSWRQQQVVTLAEVPNTVADGLRTRFIGQRNLAVMRRHVADMLTVTEAEILEALSFIWERLKLVVEPSAAVALAPLLNGRLDVADCRVGIILSGGNINVAECGFLHRKPPAEAHPARPARPAVAPTPEQRSRVLVCDPVNDVSLAPLQEIAEVDKAVNLDEEALLARIGHYQALLVGPGRRITGQMLEYGVNLRGIACTGPHLDTIDVSAARALGITLINAAGSNAVAIAEHTLTWLLRLSQELADGRLAGKMLGIVGFGAVAQQVAHRARAFDMRIVANQPRLTPELAMAEGVTATDLHELLRRADYVSLHVPFKKETDTILGPDELALLKPTACLINTGHTDLVDDVALLAALEADRLAGAVVPALPPELERYRTPVATVQLHRHPRVMLAPHVTSVLGSWQREAVLDVTAKLADLLRAKQPHEALSLEVVPVDQVIPHEQIDDKRVSRLMDRLEADGVLVNPPVTTFWRGRYVVLDGATRATAFRRLGYPHLIVQVAAADRASFELHTWYHAISSSRSFAELMAHLDQLDGLTLSPWPSAEIQDAFQQPRALCYFLDREGNATLAQTAPGTDRLPIMNALVARYTAWGDVERTLIADLARLLAQFPRMTAVAIFPQFRPDEVFDTARRGELLPAGLTRFVIPGRILRLNADLDRLKGDEPLAAKRAWLNQILEEKLSRRRLRYYQEPVILLDE